VLKVTLAKFKKIKTRSHFTACTIEKMDKKNDTHKEKKFVVMVCLHFIYNIVFTLSLFRIYVNNDSKFQSLLVNQNEVNFQEIHKKIFSKPRKRFFVP